jgi:uncharacterized protein DUF4350
VSLTVWDRSEAGPAPGPDATAGGAPDAGGGGTRPGQGSRRRRVIVAAAVVLAFLLLVAGVLALRSRSGNSDPLDPRNPGSDGAQAVARVLDDRGVAVHIARSQADLRGLDAVDADTTVVITRPDALSAETAAATWDIVRDARRVVLVEPRRFVLESLGLPVSPAGAGAPTRSQRAGCVIAGVSAGDEISAVGSAYTSPRDDAGRCFTFEGVSALVRLAPEASGGPEVVVLGAGEILSNGEVTRHDNAGVALRLLGQGDRLVWYIPSYLDVSPQDTTPESELPRALGPLTLLLLVALLATMLWRGRRFGPLVTEPLPAVVRAIETTQSRGRLYRRARDTERAGAILRAAAVRRLALYLGLPAEVPPGPVAEAAARATGRPLADVDALLAGRPPADEDEMIALANDLTTLEKEVHRP